MSTPSESEKVKLITSLFSPQKDLIDQVIREMESIFGFVDWKSRELFFDRTKYYAREMGWPLFRRFISFKDLIRPEDLIDVKLKTNHIEKQYVQEDKRKINIDPGYIALERLILATGKNYTHRIYLGQGIYADLTLIYQRGTFQPLEWTYRDYSDPEMIDCFNRLREGYKNQLRETVPAGQSLYDIEPEMGE
jgi:hypothetical protein